MLDRLIGEDMDLTLRLAHDLDPVKVDPGQLEQVVVNLVVNARDAMPRGGAITIETGNAEVGEGDAAVALGRYVVLTVSDTGCGMTDEVKRHLFEPFFTTKPVGKGTGLGLATVFGIVEQNGGSIRVDSTVGAGTAIRIYLSSVTEAAPALRRTRLPKPVRPGTETVLLVEDEGAVRTMARLALRAQGYTVLEAGDREEAVRVSERHPGPIHLLVSDVVMPRMGGGELGERLVPQRPEMRVMFMSGHTDDAVVCHGVLQAEVAFLPKPEAVHGGGPAVQGTGGARCTPGE